MESDLTGLDAAKPRLPRQVGPKPAGPVCYFFRFTSAGT
jgi:hypothetical protein